MKTKRIIALITAVMLICLASVSAFAQPIPRWDNAGYVSTVLTITGTTAKCSVKINGKAGTTLIEGDMVLEDEDGNIVDSWTFSTSGTSINTIKTAKVKTGISYTLYVDATVERNDYSENVSLSDSATA